MRRCLVLMLLVGCGEKEPVGPKKTDKTVESTNEPDDTADANDGNDALLAAAAALYAPDRVLEIALEMSLEDHEALAEETNDIFSLLEGDDCMDEPPKTAFNWYSADIVVDGEHFDNVGVRKKGLLGSLSSSKPGLKIEFDRFVDEQTLDGIERLTLNNSVSDPTLVRQCLGYQLFRDAGIPAPRCNFAHLTLNGEDLGVYVNVEPLKKTFLKWAFDGDDDGDLYEGTLSDFRDGWTATFEAKTNDTNVDLSPIHDVRQTLEIADDTQMLAALEEEMELDKFYDFWVMELIIGHVDGHTGNTNNYYVYVPEDSGKLQFIPWGIDATFMNYAAYGSDASRIAFANSLLSRRLWEIPQSRDVYYERMEALLETVWNEAEILAEIDRMTVLVEPYALDDDGERTANQDNLRDFVSTRAADIEALMELAPYEFDVALRASVCLIEAGTLLLEFDTTWGTLQSPDPFNAGYGRISGTMDGVPFDRSGGAIAGMEGDKASFASIASIDASTVEAGVISIPRADAMPGPLEIDGLTNMASLVRIDITNGEETTLGTMWTGTLNLNEFTGVPGSVARGDLEGTLYTGGPF